MEFVFLDALSLPGNPTKPNDDAWAQTNTAAAVFDGATNLGEPLLPGESDAAWLARFGARRLMAHCQDGAGRIWLAALAITARPCMSMPGAPPRISSTRSTCETGMRLRMVSSVSVFAVGR